METKLTSRQWVALLFEAIHGCLKQFMNESGSQMELISLFGVFSFSLQHNFTNLYTTARSKKSSTSTGISKMETKLTSRQWVALLFEAIHGCLKQFMNESGSQMKLISLFEIKKNWTTAKYCSR
jgi:peptidyl-tRNA hydrolase